MGDSTDRPADGTPTYLGQRYDKPDFILQGIINGLNDRGTGSLTITVQSHGMLVSGHLIGGREYFHLLGEQFAMANGTDPSTVDEIREQYKSFAAIYEQDRSLIPESSREPSYIHLRDAKFFTSFGRAITNKIGVLWRGRLIEVSGFFVGEITFSEN
jgi:hypothetical protein